MIAVARATRIEQVSAIVSRAGDPQPDRLPGAYGKLAPMQFIGSLIYTTFFFLWTFFYAIFFVIACSFLPFRHRFRLARLWGAVLLRTLKWCCRLDYPVEGAENIPADNHIALWKHSSSWETVAMAVVFPRQVWVLKRELLWVPFVGWGIRQLHAIAIDR